MDFAESHCCVFQDEVQVTHWNQRNVVFVWNRNCIFHLRISFSPASGWPFHVRNWISTLDTGFHPAVVVSDNTDHSKFAILPFIYTIFRTIPRNIKKVTIWSDAGNSSRTITCRLRLQSLRNCSALK